MTKPKDQYVNADIGPNSLPREPIKSAYVKQRHLNYKVFTTNLNGDNFEYLKCIILTFIIYRFIVREIA
jgi:hypothetical protein